MNKIFAVYKPKGPTSHDIIQKIREITGIKKVGHAGTLDPLASGVLVVGVGREATKKLAEEVAKEKEYIAKIKLGETSSTDDEEGEKTKRIFVGLAFMPTRDDIERIIKEFVGEITQIPPIYSALKIKGKPAYKYARSHRNVNMQPRQVLIKKIDVLEYQWPYIQLRVVCGPGVYIRALARDVGQKLGAGGYLAELERTRIGKYTIKDVVPIEGIKDL